MKTITESDFRITGSIETCTSTVYSVAEDGERKILKTILVRNDTKNNYVQTHIYDEWGYKTMWYDNHGHYQKFGRVVKTAETALKQSQIGTMDGDSWYITDTDRNLFEGKFYDPKDYQRMRLHYFREPRPNHIKTIKEIP